MIELEDLQKTFRAMLSAYPHVNASDRQPSFALDLAYSVTEGNTQPSDKYKVLRSRFLSDMDDLLTVAPTVDHVSGFVTAIRDNAQFNGKVRDAARTFVMSTTR